MSKASGKPKHDPTKSVFINLPYDDKFDRILNAIFFATVCCGFVPRSALEWDGSEEHRLRRIMNGLASSKYSIHDLSRFRGEGKEKLARFNMPLELGMAVALSHVKSKGKQMPHRWVALVPEGELHHQVISDLSGYDQHVRKYDGTENTVAQRVFSWLNHFEEDAISEPPYVVNVIAALKKFQGRVKKQQKDYGEKIWKQMLKDAKELAPLA